MKTVSAPRIFVIAFFSLFYYTAFAQSYCSSNGVYTTFEYINNVTLGTINNTSGNNNGYANYTGLSTNLTAGSSYTISITPGFPQGPDPEYFTVYIDYNHNGLFTDAGELVAEANASGAVSATINVPTTALTGATRMRVQMQYAYYETNPCATYTFGEVEDYTVNIVSATACNAPTGMATSGIASTSANLKWAAVSGATGYNIQYRVVGTTTWSTGRATIDSLSIAGLTASTNYEWQVQTVCSSGSSAFTASTDFTTAAAPCNVPTGMATVLITSNSARFTWTAVAGAADYNVQYRIVGTTTWSVASVTADSINIGALTASSNYEWQVQTACSSSNSAYTVSTDFTTLGSACNAPTGLSTANITNSSATFKWATVSGASSYKVQYMVVGGTTWTSATASVDSFNVTGLTVGTNYEWEVQTVCTVGTSALTAATNFSTVCPAPSNLQISNIASGSATFSWTSAGSGLDYFLVYEQYPSGNGENNITNGTSTSYQAMNLTQGTTYQVQVATGCNTGYSTILSTLFTTTCSVVPTDTSTANITSTGATFKWASVSGAADYNIQYMIVGGTIWTSATVSVDSFNVTGLTQGTNYQWEVQTVCSNGSSAFTAAATFTTSTPCNTPTGMSTSNIANISATFKWANVSGASKYNLQYRIVGTTTWATASATADSFSATNLTASSNYEWQVQTVCSAGTSVFTVSTNFNTLTPPCNTPAGMSTANISGTSATYKWAPVSGGGNYNIRYRPVGTTNWLTGVATTDSFTATGLTSSTNYEWQVQTVCTTGSSDTACITLQQGSTKATGAIISSSIPTTAGYTFASGYSIFFAEQWTNGGTPTEARSLMEYSLSQIPTGSTIVSAVLNLYAADSLASNGYAGEPTYGSSNACYLHQVTGAWNAATVDWNNQPAVSATSEVLLAQSTNYDENYLNLNVKSMVQSWVDTPANNYGVLLQMIGSSYYNSMIFCSPAFTNPALWPQLAICYLAPTSSFTASTDFTTSAACNTPTGMSTANITSSSATFKWASVSGATSYKVQYMVVGGTTWTSATASVDSFNVSGLTASTNYQWEVQTVCSGGSSAFTAATAFTTTAPPCSVPTGISTSNITNSSATFKWAVVSGASSYKVQYMVVGATAWTSATASVDSFNVSGLTASTNYEWEVQTVCSGGSSAFTAATTFTTAAPPCSIPTGMSTSNITSNSATFKWAAVSGASSYKVQYMVVGGTTWTSATATVDSFNSTSLISGDEYEWEVQTVCTVGGTSAFSSALTFNTVCAPPNNLSTILSGGEAEFSWNAASSNFGWNIRYMVVGGSTWTTANGLSVLNYTTPVLLAGTTYEWEVQAECPDGNSSFTAPQQFTTPCSLPATFSTVNITSSSATLKWTPVSGGSSYVVQYMAVGGSTWTSVATSGDSINVSGLLPGDAYEWELQTICSVGSTAFSSPITFSTTCNTPTGVSTANITSTSATFKWTPVTGATSYSILYALDGIQPSIGSTTTDSFNVTGLSPGEGYQWQIQTECSAGSSTFTSLINFTTLCGPPTGLSTTNITSSTATINWNNVSFIQNYVYRYRAVGTTNWTSGAAVSGPISLGGLSSGTPYEWQVQAVCYAGTDTGVFSASADFTTLGTAPCNIPTGLLTVNIFTNVVTLKWAAVSGATSYVVQYSPGTNGTWTSVTATTDSLYLTGLIFGTKYQWEVQTVCPAGSSAFSATASFITNCIAPTNLTVNVITDSSVILAWTDPDPLSVHYNFNIYYGYPPNNYISEFEVFNGNLNGDISGLTPATNYIALVAAQCQDTAVADLNTVTFTTASANCNAPSGLNAVNVTPTTATLEWTPVPGASGYTVQYQPMGASTWNTLTTTADSIQVSGLIPDVVNYDWQVSTVCSSGNSEFTYSVFWTPCLAPTNTTTTNITATSATFNWAYAGGVYDVQYKAISASTWLTYSAQADTFNATGLNPGTTYEWEVEIDCGAGPSFGPATNFTTLGTCNTPTGTSTANITSSSATFKWAAVSGASSYKVQYMVVGGTTWTSATASVDSFNVSGLTSSTNYVWQVQTICSSGSSAFTTSTGFSTTGACSIPTGLLVDNILTGNPISCDATLSWFPVTGALSYNIQSEIVIINGTWGGNINLSVDSTTVVGYTVGQTIAWHIQTVCATGVSAYSINDTFTFPGGCSYPQGMTTLNITSTSAILTWEGGPGINSFTVRYHIIGSPNWIYGSTVTDSFTAAGLTPGNNYEWQLETNCTGSSSGFRELNDFTTLSGGACNVPTGMATSNITASQATFKWLPVSGAGSYSIQYMKVGGSTWTAVTSATDSVNVNGLTSGTAYEWEVQSVCSGGNSAFTAATTFNTVTLTYCASKGVYTTFEYINNVTLGSINNTSGNNNGYANYTNLSTNLAGGSTNAITIAPGFTEGADPEYYTVYIDYNQNGLFTDAGEMVLEVNGSSTVSGNFTVPVAALNGPTRMRIQMQYSYYETNPCATYTFGEVEDYTVNITGNLKELELTDNSQELPGFGDLKIYPNPTQSNLNVQFNSDEQGKLWLNVYNISGQRVLNQERGYDSGLNTQSIDVAALSDGIYILEIQSQGLVQRQKFIIAR